MRWMKRVLSAGIVVALSACTPLSATFPEAPPPDVWATLLAVAKTPDYSTGPPDKRWIVKANEVYVDEGARRIEIYRELDRVLHRPGTQPLREQRTWRFQVTFDEKYPPSAVFLSRGPGVPMQARAEGKRYFGEVHDLLAGGYGSSGSVDDPATPDRPFFEVDAHKSSER